MYFKKYIFCSDKVGPRAAAENSIFESNTRFDAQEESTADAVLSCEQLKAKCKRLNLNIGKRATKESLIQTLRDSYKQDLTTIFTFDLPMVSPLSFNNHFVNPCDLDMLQFKRDSGYLRGATLLFCFSILLLKYDSSIPLITNDLLAGEDLNESITKYFYYRKKMELKYNIFEKRGITYHDC